MNGTIDQMFYFLPNQRKNNSTLSLKRGHQHIRIFNSDCFSSNINEESLSKNLQDCSLGAGLKLDFFQGPRPL